MNRYPTQSRAQAPADVNIKRVEVGVDERTPLQFVQALLRVARTLHVDLDEEEFIAEAEAEEEENRIGIRIFDPSGTYRAYCSMKALPEESTRFYKAGRLLSSYRKGTSTFYLSLYQLKDEVPTEKDVSSALNLFLTYLATQQL